MSFSSIDFLSLETTKDNRRGSSGRDIFIENS